MEPQALDRLLMDQALGALPEDVTALIEAYLQEHPAAASAARTYHATADLARQALGAGPLGPRRALPPPRFLAGRRTARNSLFRRKIRRIAAMAACALLGLAAGMTVSPLPRAGSPPSVVRAPAPTAAPLVPVAAGPARGSDFWSVSRLHNAVPATTSSSPRRLRWAAPFRLDKGA